MPNLNEVSAFDPKRLALMLAHLPEGSIVFALGPTGPVVASPKSEPPVIGGFVYDGDRVEVWSGSQYLILGQLVEFDGKPAMKWHIGLP